MRTERIVRNFFFPLTAKLSVRLIAAAAVFLTVAGALSAADVPARGLVLSGTHRIDLLTFYYKYYPASESYKSHIAWTGNVASGVAGTTGTLFKSDMLRRINFYRGMCGLDGNISFNATESAKDQEAALMFSANGNVSHNPPATWKFRTTNAVNGAANSLISYGIYGPPVIDDYMRDDGTGNEPVGHRRWLLYTRATMMGTGDIPTTQSYFGSNALWVIGGFKAAPTNVSDMRMTAWPIPGYFPVPFTPKRWSMSYSDPNADFTHAVVSMKRGSVAISASNIKIISRAEVGAGDRSIAWEVSGLPKTISGDTPYTVTVSGVRGPSGFTGATYTTTLFDLNVIDPTIPDNSVPISRNTMIPITGGTCGLRQISGADNYQLRVAKGATVTLLAGDLTPPPISKTDSFAYVSKRNAFHLAFPGPEFENQVLGITKGVPVLHPEASASAEYREFLPSSTARLNFYQLSRFATTTTTLSAEISVDNGNRWTTVWSRHGAGLASAYWDAFTLQSISLAAYANRPLVIRFILRHNDGSTVIENQPNDGLYVDAISVSGCKELVRTRVQDLTLGNVNSFWFDSAAAGETLVANTNYYLRIQPVVAGHRFGFGPPKGLVTY